jgi:hypothetical protein
MDCVFSDLVATFSEHLVEFTLNTGGVYPSFWKHRGQELSSFFLLGTISHSGMSLCCCFSSVEFLHLI